MLCIVQFAIIVISIILSAKNLILPMAVHSRYF